MLPHCCLKNYELIIGGGAACDSLVNNVFWFSPEVAQCQYSVRILDVFSRVQINKHLKRNEARQHASTYKHLKGADRLVWCCIQKCEVVSAQLDDVVVYACDVCDVISPKCCDFFDVSAGFRPRTNGARFINV